METVYSSPTIEILKTFIWTTFTPVKGDKDKKTFNNNITLQPITLYEKDIANYTRTPKKRRTRTIIPPNETNSKFAVWSERRDPFLKWVSIMF